MGKTLKKIFKQEEDEEKTNRIKNSKNIIYRIKKKKVNYKETSGNIIIQILNLLNEEQIIGMNIDERDKFANEDNEKALQDYVQFHTNLYLNNKFSELFHGLLKRKLMINQKIIYSYESYSYIELNLVDIYNKLSSEGRVYNCFNVPVINLFDAIKEEFSFRSSIYKQSQSFEEKSIFSTAPYLIFILNSQKTNQNQIYNYFNYGVFIFGQEIDLSQLVEYKENMNKYTISSIIKEKNININNINDNSKYVSNNVDENGQFYYFENNNKINGVFNNPGYYEHILIYKQLNN